MTDGTKSEANQLVNAEFGAEEKNLIKATLLPGCTDTELQLFCMVCKRTKLDPFQKQITAFGSKDEWGNRKLVFVTTIDGYRAIAERSGHYEGQTPPMWCDDQGRWMDVWLQDKPPFAAKVGIYRKGAREAIYGVARFSSFAKYAKGKDGKPYLTKNWSTLSDHMLAKVAEAQGLRKAFSNDLSGIYTFDEFDDETIKEGSKGVHEYKQLADNPKAHVQPEPPITPQNHPEPQAEAKNNALAEDFDAFLEVMEFNDISHAEILEILRSAKLATGEKTLKDLPPHVVAKMVTEKWTNRIIEIHDESEKAKSKMSQKEQEAK